MSRIGLVTATEKQGQPRLAPEEDDSVAPEESLEDPRITRKGDHHPKSSPPTLKMVGPAKKCPSRSSTTPTQPCSSDL